MKRCFYDLKLKNTTTDEAKCDRKCKVFTL